MKGDLRGEGEQETREMKRRMCYRTCANYKKSANTRFVDQIKPVPS